VEEPVLVEPVVVVETVAECLDRILAVEEKEEEFVDCTDSEVGASHFVVGVEESSFAVVVD